MGGSPLGRVRGDLPAQRGALSPSSGRGLQEAAARLRSPSSPGHSHLLCFWQQSLGTQVLLVVAMPCVVAVVGSKATKASCQGSPIQEDAPAGHPVTRRRPQPATAWLCADPDLHAELCGCNIYLRKVQVLPLVSSLTKVLLFEMVEGNSQYLCTKSYKFCQVYAMPAVSSWGYS